MGFSMKKLKLLLVALIIINIIFASIIFIDIQFFESPDIEMKIDILDVNSEEIILGTNIEIKNPNNFDMIINNLNVESKTDDGKKIGEIKIKGGKINSNSKKTFESIDNLSFKSNKFKVLENTVETRIGVNFLGIIQKTIPLKITVITTVGELFKKLKQPDIEIHTTFDELTKDGVNFSTSVDLYNPTGFEFKIDNLLLDIITDEDKNVGQIEVKGDVVKPESREVFTSRGNIDYESLDAKQLYMNVKGVAGAKIAGITQNITFSADASFDIPEIKEFVFNNETIDFGLPLQFKFRFTGILGTVGFKMYNPSNVPLLADNLICRIYRLDGDNKTLLGEEKMDACNIPPRQRICSKTEILLPYTKFLFSGAGKILPDWIVLRIDGDFSIDGTKQVFPISINGFVDPHLFKNTEFADPNITIG